jgi:phospholipid transport system substrate-binding protein
MVLSVNLPFARADEPVELTPYQLVEQLTLQVLSVVRESKDSLGSDPESFYQSISDVLSPFVAFDYISDGVMGRYAKEATIDQRRRFSLSFKSDMMSTYAKGMVAFGDDKVEVIHPEQSITEQSRVSVKQKVYTEKGDHEVIYSMGKSKNTGKWLLLNVVIDGVNLGSTFRSQFSQAMQKEGDLEAVIANWSVES